MGIHQIDKLPGYVRYLQENSQELDLLFKELLIGVTSFFRDPAAWEELRKKILPALIASRPNGHVPVSYTHLDVYKRQRPQHMTIRTAGDERGKNFFAQLLPAGGVAEETRHADQQLLEKQIQFLRIFPQVADITGELVNLMDAHAPFDAAVESIFFVVRKIVAGVQMCIRDRSEIIQHRRAQFTRELMHDVDRFFHQLLRAGDVAVKTLGVAPPILLQSGEADVDARQSLGDDIVQLATDALALFFLRVQNLTGEIPQLFLHLA